MEIEKETSDRITSLRFLLVVFVVFIHNDFRTGLNVPSDVVFNQSEVGLWIQRIISGGFATGAVPLFFLFSAYLQVLKSDLYGVMLKKRVKSLVLPYFLWIGLYLACKLVVVKFFQPELALKENNILSWTFADFIHNVFGFSEVEFGNPLAAEQFWFVRDLFIYILVSPVLIWLIRKAPVLFFIGITAFSMYARVVFDTHLPVAFFYYICGLYCGILKINVFKSADRIPWVVLLSLFSILIVCKYYISDSYFNSNWFVILTACFIFLKISKIVVQNNHSLSASCYLSKF